MSSIMASIVMSCEHESLALLRQIVRLLLRTLPYTINKYRFSTKLYSHGYVQEQYATVSCFFNFSTFELIIY